jgi:hypothetical protein
MGLRVAQTFLSVLVSHTLKGDITWNKTKTTFRAANHS